MDEVRGCPSVWAKDAKNARGDVRHASKYVKYFKILEGAEAQGSQWPVALTASVFNPQEQAKRGSFAPLSPLVRSSVRSSARALAL